AEDGIRDFHVTGVQTCALPILDEGRPRFETDREERDALAARLFAAFTAGDVDGLRELLAADVELVSDAGGKAPALPRAVVGADKIGRASCRERVEMSVGGVAGE